MMTIDIKERNLGDLLPVLLGSILTLMLLTSCGTASSQAPAAPPALVTLTVVSTVVTTPSAALSPTGVSTASATPLPTAFDPEPTIYFPPPTVLAAAKIAFETQVAENRRVQETAIALTPPPTDFIQLETPAPTPTWTDGAHGCGLWYSSDKPYYSSCWRVTYNSTLLLLAAGNEGREGDIHQGVLLIEVYNTQQIIQGKQLYYTPTIVGGVHVAPFTGTLAPIVPNDPAQPDRFFFDLVTRQWVNPAGTPLPLPQSSPVVLP